MIVSPAALLATLVIMIVAIDAASRLNSLSKVMDILPPVTWIYLVPVLLTTIGLIPTESKTYDQTGKLGVPFAIMLLILGINIRDLVSLGRPALIMMAACLVGTVAGLLVAFLIMQQIVGPDSWQSVTAVAASWIGGYSNVVAVQQAMNLSPSAIGAMLVADAIVGTVWFALLLYLAPSQYRLDKWLKAKPMMLPDAAPAAPPAVVEDSSAASESGLSLGTPVAIGLFGTAFSIWAGDWLHASFHSTALSPFAFSLMIVTLMGVVLSFTPLRRYGQGDGNRLSVLVIYIVLATVGAKTDLSTLGQVPALLAALTVALLIHAAIGLGVARIAHIPFAFFVVGSSAGIGGVISGPVIARTYGNAYAAITLVVALSYYTIANYLCITLGYYLQSL
jgi:uncharacterized membrane protein